MTRALLLVLLASGCGTHSIDSAGDAAVDMSASHDDAADGASDAGHEDAAELALVSSVFAVDSASVVQSSNLVFSKPNTTAQESVALGNGTLGAAVWAAGGFTAQLNRTDTFPDRKAVGQVVIPGLAAMTSASDFSGTLDLYDALWTEKGGGLSATVFVRADAPELIVDVSGADPATTQTAQIKLWSGRTPAGLASGAIATMAETWQDGSGLGASGQTFGVLSGITVGGRNVVASVVDALTIQVSFQPNTDGSFRVVVAAPTWTGGDAMATAKTVLGTDATVDATTLRAGHLAYWHSYWSNAGLIKMTSTDGTADYLESIRTLYLYLAASDSRGILPGSQAGVADLFSFLQDEQPWFPAAYWFWNTRMYVAANLSSGVFALNTPIFNLYQSNLANIAAWTKSKMGGRAGLCVPETMRFNGNGYYQGAETNASCDQTITPSYNSLNVTSGTEVSLWIWQQYLMTRDVAFLTKNYPVMSGVAQFLLAYATTGSDKLLHTVGNAHETQWNVQDPVTDLCAMQALFTAVIAAAGVLDTDAALVASCKSALAQIPPLPRTDAATHKMLLTAADDSAGTDVIALSYQPTAPFHNAENLDLEAVWPYGLIGDESAELALAKRTYVSRMFKNGYDWAPDALQAARLGLASEVAADLTTTTEKFQVFVGGLSLFDGGHSTTSEPYMEQTGIVTAAINEAFVQDYDGLLRIAPAWPAGWNGAGTVYVQGNAKVDVQVQGGVVVMAIVEAKSASTFKVRNPWPGMSTVVVDGATSTVVVPSTTAASFSFDAVADHWYAIVPANDATNLPRVDVTGVPAVQAQTLGAVSLGL